MKKNGKLISYIRNKDVSVTDLAEAINVDRATIYKWDKLKSYPTIDIVIDISNYLKVDLRIIAGLFI